MILLLGCMYKHTYALLEAGQPAQQTHYKRNSKEVEHELLLGFTHQAVMGGGKEENSTKQWSKICCEHTILRNVEKKKLKSWFMLSKIPPEHFIQTIEQFQSPGLTQGKRNKKTVATDFLQ